MQTRQHLILNINIKLNNINIKEGLVAKKMDGWLSLEGWAAILIARLLAPAALRVRIPTKIKKWAT